jgi:hypothetical protein
MKSAGLTKRLYQRDIPIFITSFVIAVLLIQYFVVIQPVDILRGAMLSWANIISLMIWLYANAVLIIVHTRRISAGSKERRRDFFESIIILGTFLFFIVIALSDPANLDRSYIYTLIYAQFAGDIFVATEAVAVTHTAYNIWKRVSQSRFTPEILVLIFVFVTMWLRDIIFVTFYVPQLKMFGDWVEAVPYLTVNRAITLTTAIGTLIVAIRALVGKEPGIIEMELA